MMKGFRYSLLILSAALVLLPFLFRRPAAAAVPDPTEQLKPFVDRIVTQLRQPDFRKERIEDQILRIKELASEHFDFHEMSKRVLARQWRALSAAQQDQFASLFAKLLGYVYIDQVDDYLTKEIKFDNQRFMGNDKAAVETLFVGADKTVSVKYAMILKGDKWMAYDVFAEGVSLVRNYNEQFKGIPQDQLIPVLEKKLKELAAEKKAQ
jgi:phospholipid transport system substrate-binding protein